MRKTLRTRSFSVFVLAMFHFVFFASCNKFEGDQTVPAYIYIERFSLQTDYGAEGSNTHLITDAWIYVNDQLVGAFELPATVPVLAKGSNKLEIRPGIKLNGIAATRAPYPFYKPFLINDFTFIEDSIIPVNPSTSYYSTAVFAWMEDFEDASISLNKTNQSDTNIVKTSPINSPEALLSDFSSFSGKIQLEGDQKVFQIASFDAFELPGAGTPVFLEIDYKCDKVFGVGLFARISTTIVNLPLIVVNNNENWNKIYVNLSPVVTEYGTADNFRVYFEADKGQDDEASFYLDNIKLIYRNN